MNSSNKKWVSAWGNATSIAEARPEAYAKDITLRYPVKLFLDTEKIRIKFDNFCGTEPIIISSANIALCDKSDRIDTNSIVSLTFGGNESVQIPAGESVYSDETVFSANSGNRICVNMYLGDFTLMRSGIIITGPLSYGYFATGNQSAEKELDICTSKKINTYYFMDRY